jgi:hypothetical protein
MYLTETEMIQVPFGSFRKRSNSDGTELTSVVAQWAAFLLRIRVVTGSNVGYPHCVFYCSYSVCPGKFWVNTTNYSTLMTASSHVPFSLFISNRMTHTIHSELPMASLNVPQLPKQISTLRASIQDI